MTCVRTSDENEGRVMNESTEGDSPVTETEPVDSAAIEELPDCCAPGRAAFLQSAAANQA